MREAYIPKVFLATVDTGPFKDVYIPHSVCNEEQIRPKAELFVLEDGGKVVVEVFVQVALTVLEYKVVTDFPGILVFDMRIVKEAFDQAFVSIEATERVGLIVVHRFVAMFVGLQGKVVDLNRISQKEETGQSAGDRVTNGAKFGIVIA